MKQGAIYEILLITTKSVPARHKQIPSNSFLVIISRKNTYPIISAKRGALLIKIELIVTELTVNEKNQANNPMDKQNEAGTIFLQSDFETEVN